MKGKKSAAHLSRTQQMPTASGWHQAGVVALLVGLLVVLTVYTDEHTMDLSLLPRLRGLYATLMAAMLLLLLPPVARRLDFSVLRCPLIFCYGAFSALSFLALLWALNPTAGFTESFKTFGVYIFLCLLCLLLPTIRDWRERLLQIVAAGALLSASWGFHQMVTLYGFALHPRELMVNVEGTMSNVNLYAGFLLIAFPLCLAGLFILRSWWRLLPTAAAASSLLIIVLLQTRAAYLGLAIALGAGLILSIIFAPALGIGPRTRRVICALAALVPLALAAFYLLAPAGNPIVIRLQSIASGDADASFGGRLMAWEITLQMIRDHFPIGVGTGNFTLRLDEYFNARTDFRGAGTNWIYPHNDFLGVFAELGVAGVIAFVTLLVVALAQSLVALKRAKSPQDAWLALGVCMTLLAYLADASFGFPLARVSNQLYLAVAFAIPVLLAAEKKGLSVLDRDTRHYPRWLPVAAIPVLGVLVLGFSYCRAAIKQEFYLGAVFALETKEMWDAALRVVRGAATPWKTTDPYMLPWAFHEARMLEKIGTKEETLEAMQRAYTQNPNRLHVINNLGTAYARVGRFDEAIALLSKTVERYPHQVSCIENLAQCYIDQDDYASALKILEQIPEDKRTEAVRTKIIGCRQALEEERSEKAGDR
jgi:O-antigen ligase